MFRKPAVVVAFALVMTALPIAAQEEVPQAQKFESLEWYTLVHVQYESGQADKALKMIKEQFAPASEASGAKMPKIFRCHSGRWDTVIIWHLPNGIFRHGVGGEPAGRQVVCRLCRAERAAWRLHRSFSPSARRSGREEFSSSCLPFGWIRRRLKRPPPDRTASARPAVSTELPGPEQLQARRPMLHALPTNAFGEGCVPSLSGVNPESGERFRELVRESCDDLGGGDLPKSVGLRNPSARSPRPPAAPLPEPWRTCLRIRGFRCPPQ